MDRGLVPKGLSTLNWSVFEQAGLMGDVSSGSSEGQGNLEEPGRIFAAPARLECSWTINNDWLSHQRLELENDLIAAYVLETATIPAAQFLGESRHATD